MNNPTTRRVLGIALVLIAAFSLLLSLLVMIRIWTMRQPLINGATSSVQTLADTLDTTNQALQVVSTTLQTATQSLDTIDRATVQATRALSDTQSALGSFSSLLGKDLPASLTAAGTAVRSAQTSARVIDDVLGALSRVPLLGLQYKPDVPLSVTLGGVASSLDGLPGTFTGLGRSVTATASSVGVVATSLGEMPAATSQLRRNLGDARAVIARYRSEVSAMQKLAASLEASLSWIVTTFALAFTFVIFWIGVAQVMVLLKGLEWMGVRVREWADSGEQISRD